MAAAEGNSDPYKATYCLAWPLRALLERGEEKAASELLEAILKKSKRITPVASKSEALFLIFQAAMHGKNDLWPIASNSLFEASLPIIHWRQRRNCRDAVLMIAGRDIAMAQKASEKISDSKLREKLIRAVETEHDHLKPRDFFW
ncbi:MAG: hypothetical protein AAF903_04435 [Pseudomonadota bacterium]